MDIARQKRTTSRSIITRSQAAASANLPKLGKFAFPKRKAESPVKMLHKKSVFRDLTNKEVSDEQGEFNDDKLTVATKKLAKTKIGEPTSVAQKTSRSKVTRAVSSTESIISSYFKVTKHASKITQDQQKVKKSDITKTSTVVCQKVKPPHQLESQPQASGLVSQENKRPSETKGKRPSASSRDSDVSPLYVTALEDLSSLSVDQSTVSDASPTWDPTVPPKRNLPPGVTDFDADNWTDQFQVSNYVTEIFNYFKSIEPKFRIRHYMHQQKDLTTAMRTVVVDWMVELQENFELNHETLYLAIKILDTYLSKVLIKRDMLQLLAAAAIFVAAKYDERFPPSLEDHLYVCEGAYTKRQFLSMEMSILRTIDFNLGFPISYRFLRRYARFGVVSMPTLTLARYILEYSLMDYFFIPESDSKLAAAALLLALKMKGTHEWSPNLQYASGYTVPDLKETTCRLNAMLHKVAHNGTKLLSIKNKYSHKVFFEVAKLPLLDEVQLS